MVLAVVFGLSFFGNKKEIARTQTPTKTDALNITYTVSNQRFKLVDGKAETLAIPGSNTRRSLRVFGEPVYGDLDNDGDDDVAVLLRYDPGGSGTFYYATIAINDTGEYISTNSVLLGDRIAPQTVEIHDGGKVVYNFAERKTGEPMTTQPSQGVSRWFWANIMTGTMDEWIPTTTGEIL